jgi:hypothetical protein
MAITDVLLVILIIVIIGVAILAFLGSRTHVKYINPFTRDNYRKDWFQKSGYRFRI